MPRKRPCRIYRRWFQPHPRAGDRQHACQRERLSQPELSDRGSSAELIAREFAQLRADKHIAAKDVAVPVDTKPGEAVQVDFGFVGKCWDPETKPVRPAYVFVMVLTF